MANLDDTFNTPTQTKVVLTREDILAALKFGKEIEVNTANGPRLKACARPNKEFVALWERDEPALRALGYTLGRYPADAPLRVTRWKKVAQQVIIQRQQARELSRATDAQIDIPVPEGMAFFGYQRAGVAFAYDKPGTLIADEPGLGKTCQAIGVVNCLPETKRIVVVCPASLKENWRREILRWDVGKRPIFIADSKVFPDMLGWVIVNYDVLWKHEEILHRLEFDVLIGDEIHYLKNKDSRRSKMVFGIKPTKRQRDAGIPEVPGIKAKKKLLLTGTPICNRPAELFPIINYLDPAAWPDFFRYALRYCDAKRDQRDHWDFKGHSNLGELQEKLRSTCFTGDTRIATENGSIEIRELVSRRLHCRVWSKDSMGRISLKPVVGWSEIENRKGLIEIKHAFGAFRCTPDHRVFVAQVWKRADEIKVGDELLSLREARGERDERNRRVAQGGGEMVLLYDLRGQAETRRPQAGVRCSEGEEASEDTEVLRGLRGRVHRGEHSSAQEKKVLHLCVQGEVDLCEVWGDRPGISEFAGTTHAETEREEGGRPQGSQEPLLANRPYTVELGEAAHRVPSGDDCGARFDRSRCGRSDGPEQSPDIRGYSDAGNPFGYRDRWRGSRQDGETKDGPGAGRGTVSSRVLGVARVELGCEGEYGGGDGVREMVYDIEVAQNHNFFAEGALVHNCMVRRLKKDVLKDLPPKLRRVIEFEPTGEMKDALLRERQNFASEEEYRKAVDYLATGAVKGDRSTYRRECAIAKVKMPEVLGYLDEAVEESGKVIIFIWHHEVAAILRAHFGDKMALIMGNTPLADRQEAVDRFQNDDTLPVICGGIMPMGVGFTLTAASRVIFIELDDVPGNVTQAEDRAHRIGQQDNVLVEHLIVRGTLDARMAQNCVAKQEIIEKALDVEKTQAKPRQPAQQLAMTLK